MSMEREEATAATINNSSSSANSECSNPVVKGKRTKRQRLHQSPAPAAAAAPSSTSSSGELSGSTTAEEDEDMANCLILLAQGRVLNAGPKSEAAPLQEDGGGEDGGGERFTSRRLADAATTTNGKTGFYVYECKTCNKCFPSFRALGGHRSSHKKPKMAPVAAATTEEKKAMDEDNIQIRINASNIPTILSGNSTAISAAATAAFNNNKSSSNNVNSGIRNLNKTRVHECSICGSEFSSGQALGGHMRRHRPAVAKEPPEVKKEKSILTLDLNLPAPADDDCGDYPKSHTFPFAGGQPNLFSPSDSLVDCHY